MYEIKIVHAFAAKRQQAGMQRRIPLSDNRPQINHFDPVEVDRPRDARLTVPRRDDGDAVPAPRQALGNRDNLDGWAAFLEEWRIRGRHVKEFHQIM
jgi:hypothetical protein